MNRVGNAILVFSLSILAMSAAGCSQQGQSPVGAPHLTPIIQSPTRQVTWSGDVDDSATVFLQAGKSWTDNVTGKGVQNVTTTFDSPLPASPVTVKLTSFAGRGQGNVIQQPLQANNYTAGIRILDPQPGKSSYKFTLSW